MIRRINISDENRYYDLGLELNYNFSELFNLEKTLSYDSNKIFVYEEDGEIYGFIHIQLSLDEADIVNIAVDKYHRRKKIGTKLIDYVINEFNLKSLNIEVRKSNPAVVFYLNNGFKIIREIPKYYGSEDAYFMKKVIE